MRTNGDDTLIQLHNDIYTENMLSDQYYYVFAKILSRREREVVLLKLDGLTDKEIQQQLHIKASTLKRYTDNIKSKYRNKMDLRVDDWLKYIKYTKERKWVKAHGIDQSIKESTMRHGKECSERKKPKI